MTTLFYFVKFKILMRNLFFAFLFNFACCLSVCLNVFLTGSNLVIKFWTLPSNQFCSNVTQFIIGVNAHHLIVIIFNYCQVQGPWAKLLFIFHVFDCNHVYNETFFLKFSAQVYCRWQRIFKYFRSVHYQRQSPGTELSFAFVI